MLRKIRSLYVKSGRLVALFSFCNVDVKLILFKSYCTSFYCSFVWIHYKKSTYDKILVAYNNVYRRILGLHMRCSGSAIHANYICNFETVMYGSCRG